MSTQVSNPEPKKSRKKMWLIIAGIIVVFAIIGAFMPKDDNTSSTAATTPATTTPAATTAAPTPSATKTEKPAPTPTPRDDVTPSGVQVYDARDLCDTYAQTQFPYGYKAHWITGNLAERIEEDTVFLKVQATITNQYKAKRDANVECRVGGTAANPQLVEFNAY